MTLRYAYLARRQYPQIFATFVEAFSDYVVNMNYLTEESLRNRWTKNNVNFDASVGAFDGDRLVGFTMLGIDDWMGRPAAFDAGTGVVRGYRGFGVAPGMFDLAVEGLRERGIPTFLLEVIQANKRAVRTYRKLGFAVTREFDCLQLPLDRSQPANHRAAEVEIEPVGMDLLPVFESFADWHPSWETSFQAIGRIPDEVFLYGAREHRDWVGFAAYYPALNWIMSIVVRRTHRRRGIATALLNRVLRDLPRGTSMVKLINVDRSDSAMLSWASRVGFESYARQYEMAFAVL